VASAVVTSVAAAMQAPRKRREGEEGRMQDS
jgi:hypothetical protein